MTMQRSPSRWGDLDPEAEGEVDLPAHLVAIGPGRPNAEAFAEVIREAGYAPVPVKAKPAAEGSSPPARLPCDSVFPVSR